MEKKSTEFLGNIPEGATADVNNINWEDVATEETSPSNGSEPKMPKDMWNPDMLRLDEEVTADMGVKTVWAAVEVKVPPAQDYFRIHPTWALPTMGIILKEKLGREFFLVYKPLYEALKYEIQPLKIYAGVTYNGEPFLWPTRLPAYGVTPDNFLETDLEIVEKAKTTWMRRTYLKQTRRLEVAEGLQLPGEPTWPDTDFMEIVKSAFAGRYITSLDHWVVRRLRGQP